MTQPLARSRATRARSDVRPREAISSASRRIVVRASESRLAGAHQDALALLAPDDLVGRGRADLGELGGVDGDVAPAALAGPQLGGADAGLGRAAARRGPSGPRGSPSVAGARSASASASSWSISAQRASRAATSSATWASVSASWAASRSWVACASSSFSMISSSASSRVLTRRSRDASSCCIRSRSLGLVIWPASIRSRSRVRRALTCSTSASALRCSVVRSSTTIRASRSRSSTSPRPVSSSVIRAISGSERRRWRSWSSRASTAWRSSSLNWACGSAFNALLGWGSAGRCRPGRPGTARGRCTGC